MLIKSSKSSSIVIIIIGVGFLLLTFSIACFHFFGEIRVFPSPSFLAYFGEALSPFIEALIRILYLGVMTLIAFRITSKGIFLLLESKSEHKRNINPIEKIDN